MNGYDLSRQWFDFAFEKTECKVQHTALYLWIVELNNRLGWKKEFGLPTNTTMEGLGIGNRGTYAKTLQDLKIWGFIEIVQESKNQYQSCIIKLCLFNNEQAERQALDQALIRHSDKHSPDTESSTVYIDKPRNNETNKPLDVVEDVPHFVVQNRKDLADDLKNDPPKLRAAPPSWSEMEVILANATEMRNTALKNNNLTEDGYLIAVSRFIGDQKAKGKAVKSEGDVRSHFLYWLPKWELIRKKELQAASNTGPPKGKMQQAIEGTKSAADELRRRRALNNQ